MPANMQPLCPELFCFNIWRSAEECSSLAAECNIPGCQPPDGSARFTQPGYTRTSNMKFMGMR